jgi:hypothetical protein
VIWFLQKNRIFSIVDEIGKHIPDQPPIIQGIHIYGNDDQLKSALKHALHSIGKLEIAPSTTVAGQELMVFPEVPDAGATVYVGAKPINSN